MKNKLVMTLGVLSLISNFAMASETGPELTEIYVKNDEIADSNMDIQVLLQEYVHDNGSVGASVGLIEDGIIKFFSYGKKSIDGTETVSENTIFEIGSITKVFTTLALMDLVTQGEVHLDDPIEMYLPDIKIPELDGKKITLRHLATHHSGISCLPTNFNPKNPLNPYEDYSVENLYEFLNDCKLENAPGEQFGYSNVGMGLLGHILCLKTGKSYEQLISDSILKKLGMKNTGVLLTAEMQKQCAKGHHSGQIVEYWDMTQAIAGAGALRSNAKDMIQFLAANMGLLNSPVADLLKKCREPQGLIHSDTNIGLGWILSHSNHADVIWHNGGTGGFRTFLGFNLKTQKGIVVLSNSTEEWPDQFGLILLDPETYKRPVVDAVLRQDFEYLKRFEGSYQIMINDQQTVEASVRLMESKLMYIVPGAELELIPEAFAIFNFKGASSQKLQFIFDDGGKLIKGQMVSLPDHAVFAELIPKA